MHPPPVRSAFGLAFDLSPAWSLGLSGGLLLGLSLGLTLPLAAVAQVSVFIAMAPPPLLSYAQPPVPGEGYIWMPGYWSWSDADRGYYWVPGTWVLAPNAGDLWTPGYWAFENAGYFWHIGYWGSHVGFYGGINYGYGYAGSGYQGGRWDHGAFRYNRAISNVNPQLVHNAYSTPAAGRAPVSRISFNGGRLGTAARPSASERQFQTAEHAGPRSEQLEHETAARGLPTQRANGPHGVPQVAATPRPSAFSVPEVEHARTAPVATPGPTPAGRGEARFAHTPPTAPQRGEPQRSEPSRGEPQHNEPQRNEPPRREPQRSEPQRSEPRAAPQARPEGPQAQQAPRAEAPRPEPRGPGGRADQPQPEGPPRKER